MTTKLFCPFCKSGNNDIVDKNTNSYPEITIIQYVLQCWSCKRVSYPKETINPVTKESRVEY